MKKLLLVVACSLCLLPSAHAGQGAEKDFQVRYESRDGDLYDVSRTTFETNWTWQVDRRSNLRLNIPYAFLTAEDNAGTKYEADGIKDMRVDWSRTVRDAEGGRAGARTYLTLSLPTGDATPNAEELTAIRVISSSGEGFVGAEFGRGFGATFGYGWLTKPSPVSSIEYKLSYAYRATFVNSETTERTDRDQLTFDIISKRNPTPRKEVNWSFSAMYKFDEQVSDFTGSTLGFIGIQDASADMDFTLTYGISSQINPSLKSKLSFSYEYRGVVDTTADVINFLPGTDLGDRVRFRYLWDKEQRPGQNFVYGLHWLNTGESEQNGTPVLDSKRNEGAVVLGVNRKLRSDGAFRAELQLGVTSDARDIVGTVGWQLVF